LRKNSERLTRYCQKRGRTASDWAFVQGSTSVLRLNFGAKNPAHRQYENRYQQAYRQTSR